MAAQQTWHEGRHLNAGANAYFDENDRDELVVIRENFRAQNEDIEGINKELGDVKLLLQVIFTTLNKDALDAIKKTYADRMGGKLQDMVNFVEGFMSAQAAASHNNDEITQGNQFKVVKSLKIPFNQVVNQIITKDRKSNGSPDSDSPNPPNSSTGGIRFDNPATAEENDAQQQIERRQQQDELLRKREAEKRKKNIIIEGVSETIWGEAGDKAVIEDMLRDMGLYQRIHELETTERIGRIRDNGRPRLIIATFSSVSAAYEITYKGYRLFNNDRFRNVYVRRDLNKREREEEKAKRKNKKRASNIGNDEVNLGNGSEQAQEANIPSSVNLEDAVGSLSEDVQTETENEEEADETDDGTDDDTDSDTDSEGESSSEDESENEDEREDDREEESVRVNNAVEEDDAENEPRETNETEAADANDTADGSTIVEESEAPGITNESEDESENEREGEGADMSESTGGLANAEESEAPESTARAVREDNSSSLREETTSTTRESSVHTRSKSAARVSGNGKSRKETLSE